VSFVCATVFAETALRQLPNALPVTQLSALLQNLRPAASDKSASAVKTESVVVKAPQYYVIGTSCSGSSPDKVALPLGACVNTGISYAMYVLTGSTLTLNMYITTQCASTEIPISTVISTGCSGGNGLSFGTPTTYLPAAPSSGGVVESFYTVTTGCSSTNQIGWYFMPLNQCIAGTTYAFQITGCSGSGFTYSQYSSSASCSGAAAVTQTIPQTTCSTGFNPNSPADYLFSVTGCANSLSLTCYAAAATGSSSTCFAGSEVVRMSSGETKAISDVVVGDSIEVYSVQDKDLRFSNVVAVPHGKNSIVADFQNIVTEQGSDIKLTAEHLLPAGACGVAELPLSRAADVVVGECIQTVAGQETVASNQVVQGEGVYTVVAEKGDYIVVNNVVASPFAVNHVVANGFYAIHRAMYSLAGPAIAGSVVLKGFLGSLNSLAAYFAK